MYRPPFTVSSEAINIIADISRLIERYDIQMEKEDELRLRKANIIRTIHSSLAIEGNTLSEDEVRDIIDGKNVVAPLREIQEVKNAIKTYELFPSLDPFKEKDLLRAHAQMMEAIIDDAGHYRQKGVGVFSENGLVHMAPPAHMVPQLMGSLFDWLKHSKDHLLVRSCVFHYEFEFIHPFSDDNGRTGRLWQSLVLGKLHPLFEHLPVENIVFANQQAYYDSIAASTQAADSGPFIDFMLGEILATLQTHKKEELSKVTNKVSNKVTNKVSNKREALLNMLRNEGTLTMAQLAERISLSESGVKKILTSLKREGIIKREGSNKTGRWIVMDNVNPKKD